MQSNKSTRLEQLKKQRQKLREQLLFSEDGFRMMRFRCMCIETLYPDAQAGIPNRRDQVKLYTASKKPSDLSLNQWRFKQQWQSQVIAVLKGRIYRDGFGKPPSSLAYHTSTSLGVPPRVTELNDPWMRDPIALYHRNNGSLMNRHLISVQWEEQSDIASSDSSLLISKQITRVFKHSELFTIRKPLFLLSVAKSRSSLLSSEHDLQSYLPRYEVICNQDIPSGVCIARYHGIEYTEQEFDLVYKHTKDEHIADLYCFNSKARMRGSTVAIAIDGYSLLDVHLNQDKDFSEAHLHMQASSTLNGVDCSNLKYVKCEVDGWPCVFILTVKPVKKGDILVQYSDDVNQCMGGILATNAIGKHRESDLIYLRHKHGLSLDLIHSIAEFKHSDDSSNLNPHDSHLTSVDHEMESSLASNLDAIIMRSDSNSSSNSDSSEKEYIELD